MTSILIADDHAIVSEGVRRLLEDEEDFQVVGEAHNGKEALELVDELNPDVLVLDIAMPDMDGFEVTKRLSGKGRKAPLIVVLTMYADEHYAARLLRMGVRGYVVKDAAATELVNAVRTVVGGERFVSESLREAMAFRYIDGLGKDPADSLTDREFQILRQLASGATNREIADQLGLSVKTVDSHRLKILAKLDLRNNAALTSFAVRHGFVKP